MKKWMLLLTIIVLGVLYVWQSDRVSHVVQDMPAWPKLAQNLVADIQVSSDTGEHIQLHKQDVWMLGDTLADAEAVQRLLDHLSEMQPIRVVTRNPEQYARLQVTDTSARIVLKDKQHHTLLDLHVGKQGSDLISTYVRLHTGKEVVAVNKALVWQVNRTQESWQKEQDPDVHFQDVYTDPYAQAADGYGQ